MPEAFSGRLLPLLPTLLALRAGGSGEPASGGGAAAPAEGAAFLLPLLLHVSDPEYAAAGELQQGERLAWLGALREPAALAELLRYASLCAAACTGAGQAADTAADDALLSAAQLLLNVVAGEQHASGGDGSPSEGASQRESRRRLAAAPEALPLLHRLLRLAERQPLTAAASPDGALHSAR